MTSLAQPHLPTLTPTQWRTVAGCAARVFVDSTRTRDIMIAEEITARAQLRHLLDAGVFDHEEGRALLRDRPCFSTLDMEALGRLPEDTLGGRLARFHRDNDLSPDLYLEPCAHTDDPTQAFLMQRLRHCHDVWHVLTGLGVRGHEEILLHAFSFAQTGLPSSIALMMLGGLKHFVLEARWNTLFRELPAAYRAGRGARPLLGVYWERRWDRPLADVRAELGIAPLA